MGSPRESKGGADFILAAEVCEGIHRIEFAADWWSSSIAPKTICHVLAKAAWG